jgi:hypothetical protein
LKENTFPEKNGGKRTAILIQIIYIQWRRNIQTFITLVVVKVIICLRGKITKIVISTVEALFLVKIRAGTYCPVIEGKLNKD